ncbi:hypothetical protein BX600DRAFT_474104 [Xylariales sp. PMI_506]|nr:hypothetical protein BX600DRAFT_474104 [Xylariales sp. PMI_506]
MDSSPLLRAPLDVRLMIYDYLFGGGGKDRMLAIRNAEPRKAWTADQSSRTTYYVLDRSMHRRCYKTTYHLNTKDAYFCPALMRVNRKLYEELSHLVYGRHTFDFGGDIEAVEPFFSDLTPRNRQLIREISLYKRGPMPLYENDRIEWRSLCRFLHQSGAIRKLRLVVQGGKPSGTWEGPKEFSANELKLLADIKHEALEWVTELAQVQGIEELEILPDVHYCPQPTSTTMLIFAAFSASIERGLTEFLRTQMRLS